MSRETMFGENCTGLGWISVIMCLPFYVVHAVFNFDLKWMTGLPFTFFYFWSLISVVLLPIFILFQFVVITKIWLRHKKILPKQMILFLFSIGLYVFATPGLWKSIFSS